MKRIGTYSVLTLLGMTATASAHIHLTYPKSRTDLPTGDQKEQHCGNPLYVRADNPTRTTTFAPGSTITVTWDETIDHPGYFRIALQPDGEIFPIPDVPEGGGFPTENRTGQIDEATGAIIIADAIPDGRVNMPIQLPDIECTNCTLQFIQMMTDKPPYTTDLNSDDIYFNCADISLVAGATNPDPMEPDQGSGGGSGSGEEDPGVEGEGALVEGGCSTTSHGSGVVFGLALLAGLRRRGRR